MTNVKFIRKETKEQINNLDIVDGQFIVCKDGSAYVDYGTERKGLGGTPDTEMSDTSANPVQNKVIKSYIDGIWDFIYPIGSYYETSDSEFDPNKVWGGTWELDIDGTVLVSCSSGEDSKFNVAVGTIVGEEEHTLSIAEIPSHSPILMGSNVGGSDKAETVAYGGSSSGTDMYATKSVGGGQAHNNVQPSKIINRWHRTA